MINRIKYILITLLFVNTIQAQNISLAIKPEVLETHLKSTLELFLGKKKTYNLDIKEINFEANNILIHNTEKRPSGGVLEVYGKELIHLDVTKPFSVDIKLSKIDITFLSPIVNLEVQPSKHREKLFVKGSILLPELTVTVNHSQATERGLTSKNYELQEKLDSMIERLKTQQLSEQEKTNLSRQAYEINALQSCIKKLKRNDVDAISFQGGGHNVQLKNIRFNFATHLNFNSSNSGLQFSSSDLSLSDNLKQHIISKQIAVNISHNQFRASDNIAVTYGLDKNDQLKSYCSLLKQTHKGLKEYLLGKVVIPKVDDVLKRKTIGLIREKLYPVLQKKLARLNIKSLIDIPQKSFPFLGKNHTISSQVELYPPHLSKNINDDNIIQIPLKALITHNEKTIEAKDILSPLDNTAPFNLNLSGDLLSKLINRVDDLALDHLVSKKSFLLKDGSPIISLKNHDLFIKTISENTFDLAIGLEVDTKMISKFLRMLLINSYDYKNTLNKLQKASCRMVLKLPRVMWMLFSHCYLKPIKLKEHESEIVSIAIDLRVEVIKNNGEINFKIHFPHAKDLFDSKYMTSNWRDSLVLRVFKAAISHDKISIPIVPTQSIDIDVPSFYEIVLDKFVDKIEVTDLGIPYYVYQLPKKKIFEKTKLLLEDIQIHQSGDIGIGFDISPEIYNQKVPKLEGVLK